MSSIRRKVVIVILAVITASILLPAASIVVTSWQRRIEAARLLACARQLHPGVTTQAQALAALSPFNRFILHGHEGYSGQPSIQRDDYWIDNYPKWVFDVAPHFPDRLNEHLWFLPYSAFSVTPHFENGSLTLLEFKELQENRGNAHPYVARVKILSTSTESDSSDVDRDFTGYKYAPYEQAKLDNEGKQVGSSWIIREYVTLDERATPKQFDNALNFRLSCLTSLLGCHDARKLLPLEQ
jgi:hypothetical protein